MWRNSIGFIYYIFSTERMVFSFLLTSVLLSGNDRKEIYKAI